MIAMALSNKQIEFVLNNYKNYSYNQLGKMLGVHQSTIGRIVKRNGLSKIEKPNKLLSEFIINYSGKVTIIELQKIIRNEFKVNLGYEAVRWKCKKCGFKSFSTKNKQENQCRLFLDGNKNNLDKDNIIIVSKRLYNSISRHLKKGYTGELLVTLIKAGELSLYASDYRKESQDERN